jgi:hypothetical protein
MSDNPIDSENISKPAPDTAKPKGAQTREEAEPGPKEGRRSSRPKNAAGERTYKIGK